MSENLDFVRSIFSAVEHGDFSDASWADPEIEYVVVDGPVPATYTGLAGLARAMRQILVAWEGFETHVDEYRDLDTERVLVLVRYTGRGRVSGLELNALGTGGAQLCHIRNGKVRRIVVYFDRERALTDLGLKG